jgi:hypothetical protein
MVHSLLLECIQFEIILRIRGDRGSLSATLREQCGWEDLTLCAICGTTSLNYVLVISGEIFLRANSIISHISHLMSYVDIMGPLLLTLASGDSCSWWRRESLNDPDGWPSALINQSVTRKTTNSNREEIVYTLTVQTVQFGFQCINLAVDLRISCRDDAGPWREAHR